MFARSVWYTAGTAERNKGGIALRTRCRACLQYDLQIMGALVLTFNALL